MPLCRDSYLDTVLWGLSSPADAGKDSREERVQERILARASSVEAPENAAEGGAVVRNYSRPLTRFLKSAMSCRVIGPGWPVPTGRPSILVTGIISAAVPVRNDSSAT